MAIVRVNLIPLYMTTGNFLSHYRADFLTEILRESVLAYYKFIPRRLFRKKNTLRLFGPHHTKYDPQSHLDWDCARNVLHVHAKIVENLHNYIRLASQLARYERINVANICHARCIVYLNIFENRAK